MMATALPLRDVHLPAAPGWWPPAPGWWLLAAGLLAALLVVLLLWLHRRRRRSRWRALFDARLDEAEAPAMRLAIASELLRRAARRADPLAVRLQGEQWLRFLDGGKRHDFSGGDGRLLLDGGFRRDVEALQATRACRLARERFVELMERRR